MVYYTCTIPSNSFYCSSFAANTENKFVMEVITIESEAYKSLVSKIEKIAGYVAEAAIAFRRKKGGLAGQQPTGGSVGYQYTYIATPER